MTTDPLILPGVSVLPPMLSEAEIARQAVRQADRTAKATKAAQPAKRDTGRRRAAVRRRFGLLNTVIDRALPHMRRTELAAWLILYRHAKPDGTVTAAVSDLARRSGCCQKSICRSLKRLQVAGLIHRIKRGTLAGGPSVWRLISPRGDGP